MLISDNDNVFVKTRLINSLPCSATYSGWLPFEFSTVEADHPVLQMWAALQRRGAASPGQPLPHKVLHLQGSVTLICRCAQMQVHLWSILQPHLSQRRLICFQASCGCPVSKFVHLGNFWRNPVKRIPHEQWRWMLSWTHYDQRTLMRLSTGSVVGSDFQIRYLVQC